MCLAETDAAAQYPARVLLVGVSVRMLAQSCRRAGIEPLALDWFGDTDTAACARFCAAVGSEDGRDFDRALLLATAEDLAPAESGTALIYGGGLDGRPDLLDSLRTGRTLFGNPPETVRAVKTPHVFFSLLDRLGIPYPPTRFGAAANLSDPDRWLVKNQATEGGTGVTAFHAGAIVPPGCYLQRHLPGPAHSLLFLANGSEIAAVGFNRLAVSRHRAERPMLFAGATTPTTLLPEQRGAAQGYARALTRALQLVGLNSLDFIIDDGQCRVLEINPRPSATLGLHDDRYRRGLLAAHLDACRGHLTPRGPHLDPPRGFRIVYAHRSGLMPDHVRWPDWAADRPRAGTAITAGHPLCSVAAEARSLSQAERQLFERERLIHAALML